MLCTLANEAKSGNKDAMAQIIEKFNPLLKKYSRKLEYGQYILGKPANGLGNRAIYQPAAS